jgi:hypothetical protein
VTKHFYVVWNVFGKKRKLYIDLNGKSYKCVGLRINKINLFIIAIIMINQNKLGNKKFMVKYFREMCGIAF